MVRYACLLCPPCLGTRTKRSWVLGPEPPWTRPGILHREGHHTSAFPYTRMVAAMARRHNFRLATCLGWGCMSLPHQLLYPSLVWFLEKLQLPCSSTLSVFYRSLAEKRASSQQGKPGVHPLIPLCPRPPARPEGQAPTGSGGGAVEALKGAPPSCCRQSHHQCLPSPDGKQAIRKFLLLHRNQKPNTTQEGEKHHKPAISRAD